MYAAGPLPRLLAHQTTCSSTNTRSFNFGKIFPHLVSLWETMSHDMTHFRYADNVKTEMICTGSKFVLCNVAESFVPVKCNNFQSPYLAAK